jgi:uncharacterized protein (DUF2062 family)
MMRKIIRRYLPDAAQTRAHPQLRLFSHWLQPANLWHLNRRSVPGAVAVGLFWAFIPSPTQMLPAAASAIALRVNLPLTLALTWIVNPLTMAPIFYFNYRIGTWLLDRAERSFSIELSWDWLTRELDLLWQPLLLGSTVVATCAAVLGYFCVHTLWRLRVVRAWTHRAGQRERQRLMHP